MAEQTSAARSVSKPFWSLKFLPGRIEKLFIAVMDRLHWGKLTMRMPSGNSYSLYGSQDEQDGQLFHANLNLKDYRAVRRIMRSKSVGFAEAYMEGELESGNLTHLLELMACNMDALEAAVNDWGVVRFWNRIQHGLRSNTRSGSRRNIAYHYDLGNDFYTQWLDPSMTYSSGLFDEQHTDLEAAQENKYRQLADKLGIESHHQILEIGCGWGGFAEFAAKNYGCKIVCLTLSVEQLNYAKDRIEKAGLSDKVEFRLEDYRDTRGAFDRIVSIEMFEAVGEEYWSTYFRQVHDLLKPGGSAGLQIISIANDRYEGYRNETDFIQKYIFPGGMLPSPEKLTEHIAASKLKFTGEHLFGMSYARTLETWRREFLQNWPTIAPLGYSTRFRRMWEYYFCYCEAGFRRGTIDVGHYFMERQSS